MDRFSATDQTGPWLFVVRRATDREYGSQIALRSDTGDRQVSARIVAARESSVHAPPRSERCGETRRKKISPRRENSVNAPTRAGSTSPNGIWPGSGKTVDGTTARSRFR